MATVIYDLVESLKSYKCILNDIDFGDATPKIITQAIPYSNKVFDFSRIVNNDYFYEPRIVTATFTYGSDDVAEVYEVIRHIKTEIMNFPIVSIRAKYNTPGYYNDSIKYNDHSCTAGVLKGIVTNINTDEDYGYVVKFTVTIRCYPFILEEEMGAEWLWDDLTIFSVLRDISFDIEGSKEFEYFISNNERPVSPVIKCTADMTITLNETYTINVLANIPIKDENFILLPSAKLPKGQSANKVLVKGTGKMEWEFNKATV